MSHQHFYSRVPSRVSLFNKMDGFDTFAYSAGLEKSFIIDELSVMYLDKLEIHSPVKLRRGEIPKVYSQAMMPSGRLVQTVISYLPKDFTGERSAYLAHSLVLSEEECCGLYENNSIDVFNPEMFISNISLFDLTARDAAGNPSIDELYYMSRLLCNGKEIMAKYNPEMVKSFIFSVVQAILGEGKDVYFRLPYADSELSDRALEFINAIMSVLPYSLRKKLSFVSYVSTPGAYEGFKLKCVSNDCKMVAADKGVFYDFATGEIIGRPVEYHQYQAHASFLYSFFDYERIRNDFHTYISCIEEKYPQLSFDVQSYVDLIFVFWQCSGFYVEESVVVNDESLCNFFDIYATYRDGLDESYRVKAYRPLGRYLKEQIAIPDGVYTRLSKLYPAELTAAKAVALDTILGLIHVDVMRERLFAFISRNYAGEIDKVKEVINANLCRVFYGGFLQNRILGHFDVNFEREPVQTRDLIIDKLLLSIRTPEVQRQIVSFLDRHYRSLTTAQKLKICTTCLEMIPECDDLSVLLIGLVNRRASADSEIASVLSSGLVKILDINLKANSNSLAAIFIDNPGFAEDIAMAHILGRGVGVDILLDLLANMPAHKRASKLIRVRATVPGMTDESYESLLSGFVGKPVRFAPSTMYEVISVADTAAIALSPRCREAICNIVIYPALLNSMLDAFNLKLGSNGIEILIAFVEKHPALQGSREYGVVINYLRMVELCQKGDTQGVFAIAVRLPEGEEIRRNIAEYLESHCDKLEGDVAECTYRLLLQYLSEGKFAFDEIYSDYQRSYEDAYREEGSLRSKIESCDRRGAADAAELIIGCASNACDSSSELADIVCAEDSGLRAALASFVETYGIGAGMLLKKHCENSYYAIGDITEELIEDRNASIGSVEDAVNLLLRRK